MPVQKMHFLTSITGWLLPAAEEQTDGRGLGGSAVLPTDFSIFGGHSAVAYRKDRSLPALDPIQETDKLDRGEQNCFSVVIPPEGSFLINFLDGGDN